MIDYDRKNSFIIVVMVVSMFVLVNNLSFDLPNWMVNLNTNTRRFVCPVDNAKPCPLTPAHVACPVVACPETPNEKVCPVCPDVPNEKVCPESPNKNAIKKHLEELAKLIK